MKSKKEEIESLNKLTTTDKEELETISSRLLEIKKGGILDEEVLKTLHSLLSQLLIKREKFTTRLFSLIRQGYRL